MAWVDDAAQSASRGSARTIIIVVVAVVVVSVNIRDCPVHFRASADSRSSSVTEYIRVSQSQLVDCQTY